MRIKAVVIKIFPSILKAYKLATGDVGQTEQEEASRKHGKIVDLFELFMQQINITFVM